MSTSPTDLRRRARRCALALIVTASVMPASSALAQQGDNPADFPGMPGSPKLAQRNGDNPADFPGMPANPQPVASHPSEASGFDWTSAAVGAGGAGVLIAVSLGGAAAASRLHMKAVRS